MTTLYTKRNPTEVELERLKAMIQRNLRGDEDIIAAYLMDEDDRESRWAVAWQSSQRRRSCEGQGREVLDSGTHVALLSKIDNSKALIWGHYDMKSSAAVADAFSRADK